MYINQLSILILIKNVDIDVVKYDTKPEDIKITTADISEKFKFFETYRTNDREKRPFRITPPREGVVKMPTPESDTEKLIDEKENGSFHDNVLQKTQTTSTMLNKFRVMEQNLCKESEFNGLRPLKCFTPPPEDIGSRYYDRSNSEEEEEEEDSDESDVDAKSLTQAGNTADEALKEVCIYLLIYQIFTCSLFSSACMKQCLRWYRHKGSLFSLMS